MTKHTWRITAGGLPHTVELEHGVYSGKRILRVDGREVDRVAHQWYDMGSVHQFAVSGAPCEVHITTNGITYDYALFADWQHVLSDRQQKKKYRPGAKVRQLLAKNDFFNNLARLTGLRRFAAHRDAPDARPYLAGEIAGYLVTVDTVFKAQPLEELLRVTVRVEPGADENVFGQMEASPAFQNWLGSSRRKQPVHGQWQGGYIVLLSMAKIPPVEATVQRIRDLLAILSAYRPPRRDYGCEMLECKGAAGDPVRLAFLQIDQVLMCDACLRSLPGRFEQAEQAYKAQPHHLERLALAALPVMLAAGLLAGSLSYWLDRSLVLFAAMGVILALILLLPKLKVKFSLWAAALIFLVSMGAAMVSTYVYELFYLVFRNYWTVSPALFVKAAEMLARNATRMISYLTTIAVLVGLWLAGGFLPAYSRKRKRAAMPEVFVGERVETLLDRRVMEEQPE